jgi:hypothetical protein
MHVCTHARAHARMLCAHLHTKQPTKDPTMSASKIVLSDCKSTNSVVAKRKLIQLERVRKGKCRAKISQHRHTRMAPLFPRRPCDALALHGIIKLSADSFNLFLEFLFPVCSCSGFSVINCRGRRDCMPVHALRYRQEEVAQVS